MQASRCISSTVSVRWAGANGSPSITASGAIRSSSNVAAPSPAWIELQMGEQGKPILEVIVCSVEDAVAAELGGANRLEIISHYEAGGLTPSFDLVQEITSMVKIPARAMLRETEPFIVADEGEIERLCDAARTFARSPLARLPLDGLVLGFLKEAPDGKRIDHDLVSRILACAPNLKATFH